VPAFLTVEWVLSLGDTPVRTRAEHRYRQFVEAGLVETANPLEPLNSGLVMGGADFLVRLRERAPDPATLVEVPRAQRFGLRPDLASLFTNVMSKDDRDARCALAVREHGYTMKEIGEFLGLHYSTVSRALSRAAGESAASRVLDFKT